MLLDYLKILLLIDRAGEIKSRKKVQKMVFLMQEKNISFNEDFSLHFFGPYSPSLQIELNQLDDAGLIQQESRFESYYFRLTDKGREFLKEKEELIKDIYPPGSFDLINELNKIEAFILEMMATIVYFEKSYGKDKDKLKEVLGGIKPRLIGHFDDAWDLLDKLDLHYSG